MHLNILQSPFIFAFIIFTIILSIYVNPSFSSTPRYNDPRYETCISNSSTCGKSRLKISYPFWQTGSPQYCGHPGFNLSCEGHNFKINILSSTYKVIDIDYKNNTLTIVNEYFSKGDPCPRPGDSLHNTTLDSTLFNYNSNVYEACLSYDCRLINESTSYPTAEHYGFSCEQSSQNQLSFLLKTDYWDPTFEAICSTQLYVPVFKHAFKDFFNASSSTSSISSSSAPPSIVVGNLLKRGFEVKWEVDQGDCQECYISGGYCAYNRILDQSTCFCEDGEYPVACSHQPTSTPSKGLDLKARVGIGVAVACGIILIILTWLVFTRRGNKQYHSSSLATSSQQTNTQPSSTDVEEKSSYFGAQLFSYTELQQATNKFESSKELGRGGFGIVYYGKLQDGREVAIKRLYERQHKQVEQFMNEVEILTNLEHKNLVKLYGCTTRRTPDLLLVYEYIPYGTVSDHLQTNQTIILPWPIRLKIAIETATALVYLHASDIIHRDVKTKNILLTMDYSVKVADFGLSRLFPLDVSHISTTPQGSPGYVDPEYHQCYQLTNKSDVYSLGVVLAELISAKPAVDITRKRQEINLSSLAVNKIGKRAWTEFVDPNLRFEEENTKVREEVIGVAELTYQCLQATSEARPSMQEVLEILKRIQGEENDVEKTTNEGDSTLEECNTNSQVSVIVNVSSPKID